MVELKESQVNRTKGSRSFSMESMESLSSTHETLRMWPSGDYFVANILCAVIFGEKASKGDLKQTSNRVARRKSVADC